MRVDSFGKDDMDAGDEWIPIQVFTALFPFLLPAQILEKILYSSLKGQY
jgi:hypothetical protein